MMAILLIVVSLAQIEETPFGLPDLEGYRSALASKSDDPTPLVSFRELWDRPEIYAGQRVTIEGRIARRFRQPRVGEFPPLVECWVMSKAGDPFCVVYPEVSGANALEIGTPVRFSGTFLRKIRYPAGDTARIVPLIVGPAQPSSVSGLALDSEQTLKLEGRTIEWMMGLGIGLMVGVILLRLYLSRPVPRRGSVGPDPIFLDGESEAEEPTDGESN